MKHKTHMQADEVEVGMLAHNPTWSSAPERMAQVTNVETNTRGMTKIWFEGYDPWYGHSDAYITVIK